ncbi:recombinase family protein [uncultured Serinicoccus sp.]|uniref:recombinase family protein n=1 Tax=uncultured Serinicoccus sp. TaxID=735514 RepID=UPI0034317271
MPEFGYARVSTGNQSVALQVRTGRGWGSCGVTETASSTDSTRPGLRGLLGRLGDGTIACLVPSLHPVRYVPAALDRCGPRRRHRHHQYAARLHRRSYRAHPLSPRRRPCLVPSRARPRR